MRVFLMRNNSQEYTRNRMRGKGRDGSAPLPRYGKLRRTEVFGDESVDGGVEFGLAVIVIDDRMGAFFQSLGRRFGFAVFFLAEVFERFLAVSAVLRAADDAVVAGTEIGVDVEKLEVLVGGDAFEVGEAAGTVDDHDAAVRRIDGLLGDVGEDVLPVRLTEHAGKLLHVGSRNVHLEDFENLAERIGEEEHLRAVTAFEIGGGGSFSGPDGTGETDDETRTHGGHGKKGLPEKIPAEYTGKAGGGNVKIRGFSAGFRFSSAGAGSCVSDWRRVPGRAFPYRKTPSSFRGRWEAA